MNRLLLPMLAIAGIAYATIAVMRTHPHRETSDPPAAPPTSPFQETVAGVGLIEASTENISIGAHLPGVVARVFVNVGQQVKASDPLFQLDDRHLIADLEVRKAALAASEAKVQTAATSLADARDQFDRAKSLSTTKVISPDEFARRDFAVQTAEARLNEARAEVTAASAAVRMTETELDRSTVRAPIDADVLQIKIRAGEYAPAGLTPIPLLVLGNIRPLHLRVDVDEHEAWRIKPDAHAVAQLRGNPEAKASLKFVCFEPLIVPKRSLTGDSIERVDTRVLQVIYEITPGDVPLFVGQQMDVFIEAAATSAKQ